MPKKPVMLIILDGWGESAPGESNAISLANKPVWDRLTASDPRATIGCSGESVGLPQGQMGNSEVGHLNLGAGRVVYQQITRIDKDIREGGFFSNAALKGVCERIKAKGTSLHLMGLLSDGGVHSHLNHLAALLELAKKEGLTEVLIHAILDGRDTPPRSAGKYIAELEKKIAKIGVGRIATVSGRYYAMDRDKRWERTLLAYKAYTEGNGQSAVSAAAALQSGYDRGENDEFVTPTVVSNAGKPIGVLKDDDGVIFFNFRPDRARQMTQALALSSFSGFSRPARIKLDFVCMSQYDLSYGLPVAYPPTELKNILGEVLSAAGQRQLRIAETEKYAHVTFFFNGQVEKPFPNEDRVLIPSPKVATYDLQPEMSAYGVTDKAVDLIKEGLYDMIVLNYANCDMVGHTGFIPATVKAVETVDTCLGELLRALDSAGGEALITADHGNAELMKDPVTGQPHTAHTTNFVPLLYHGPRKLKLNQKGILADLAPTILELMGLTAPPEMEGRSLIIH